MKVHRTDFRVKSNSGDFGEHDLDSNNIKVNKSSICKIVVCVYNFCSILR